MVSGNGISIRDYAKQHGISYEAVRKQIKRFNAELSNHITTVGKKMYLDNVAVAFLDDRRQNNPVFISQQSESEQINDLKLQIDALKNELMTTQKRVIELQSENQLMLADKIKYDLLLESSNEKQATIDSLRDDLKSARADAEQIRKESDEKREKLEKERDAAQADARSYRKSVFGFYRKIKG